MARKLDAVLYVRLPHDELRKIKRLALEEEKRRGDEYVSVARMVRILLTRALEKAA
jgi:hypothetical protein